MSDNLHDRIRQRLAEIGMTPEAASKAAGFDRNYLRKMFDRPGSAPRVQYAPRLADALKVSVPWLLGAADSVAPRASAPSENKTLPVYGLAAGSLAGALSMSPEPVEWVYAPPGLAAVRGAYALIVKGGSMEPRYFSGDIVYIHPHRPVRPGDHVILQIRHGSTVSETWVKRFKANEKEHVVAEQYNPRADVRFKRGTVAAMHRIMTVNELFGI